MESESTSFTVHWELLIREEFEIELDFGFGLREEAEGGVTSLMAKPIPPLQAASAVESLGSGGRVKRTSSKPSSFQ